VSSWFVFVALAFLLGWCFVEIDISLVSHTWNFWPLAIPFSVAAALLVIGITLRLWKPEKKKVSDSGPGRVIWLFGVLSVVSPVLAVLVARAIKPAYDFQTPLLRLAAALMKELWS
jgi:hypothetical protein